PASPRALHPSPTRRSSDLAEEVAAAGDAVLGVGLDRLGLGVDVGDDEPPVPGHADGGDAAGVVVAGLDRAPDTRVDRDGALTGADRKSTRLNSSHVKISYA